MTANGVEQDGRYGCANMSGLELVARLADALAWPVFALIIAMVLRHPVSQALSQRPLSKVKAGPFEVEWDRTAAETEKEVEAIGILHTTLAQSRVYFVRS